MATTKKNLKIYRKRNDKKTETIRYKKQNQLNTKEVINGKKNNKGRIHRENKLQKWQK